MPGQPLEMHRLRPKSLRGKHTSIALTTPSAPSRDHKKRLIKPRIFMSLKNTVTATPPSPSLSYSQLCFALDRRAYAMPCAKRRVAVWFRLSVVS